MFFVADVWIIIWFVGCCIFYFLFFSISQKFKLLRYGKKFSSTKKQIIQTKIIEDNKCGVALEHVLATASNYSWCSWRQNKYSRLPVIRAVVGERAHCSDTLCTSWYFPSQVDCYQPWDGLQVLICRPFTARSSCLSLVRLRKHI